MEKLDRPYKRDGKTITHRVVCGKVRKMRGGALSVKKFRKSDGDFKFDTDFFKPVIFFGKIEGKEREGEGEVESEYYEFAIFNKEHRGGPVGILQLVKNNDILVVKPDIEKIFTPASQNNAAAEQHNAAAEQHNAAAQNNNAAAQNNNAAQNELKEKLQELYDFLKQDKTKYKRIRGFIYYILNINENNNIPEIFKREIPTDLPEGFDYIPYVAYQNEIINELNEIKKKNFNIDEFINKLPKTKDNFKPIGKQKKYNEKIPEMVKDNEKRNYSLDYYQSNIVYLFIFDNSIYFSNVIDSEYYSIIFENDGILYIGIVYNYNQNIVVIFYPILNVYKHIISLELDFIYSVYYSFFIMYRSSRSSEIWKNYYKIICQFYVKYISIYITYDTLKKICNKETILKDYNPEQRVDFKILLTRKNRNKKLIF